MPAWPHGGIAEMVSDRGEHNEMRDAAAQRESTTALLRHGCERSHRVE